MNFEDFENVEINYETKIYENLTDWNNQELIKSNKNDLIIIHINIRTLSRNTFLTLQVYLENKTEKIDVIILTETNCKPEEINLYKLPNYNSTYYCREKRRGGGIIIYTKEKLNIQETKNIDFKYAENVEIEIEKKNLIINAIYRPPNLNVKEFLKELKKWLKHKDVKNKDLVIIGDININTLEDNNNTLSYIELLHGNGILNTINNNPTREEVRNNSITTSCIDHINLRTKYKYTAAIIKEKIADHYFITTTLKNSKIIDENALVEIKIINDEKVNDLIMEYDWRNLIEHHDNLEELYNEFVNVFKDIYKQAEKTIKLKTSTQETHGLHKK